jgi:hypothetical protein
LGGEISIERGFAFWGDEDIEENLDANIEAARKELLGD